MTLVNIKELLEKAESGNYALGSFSVANMEMIIGAIKAAEETNSPIILQIAEARLNYSPLDLIGPIMVNAAIKVKVPVAVHFDHGITLEQIKQALDIGFTSVMLDGSHLSIDKNIEITNKAKEIAISYNADIEAEIGHVGGSEDGSKDRKIAYTKLDEANKFLQETKVDALAVAIGNAHGIYKVKSKIRHDILRQLNEKLNVPLVLHGSSGISEGDLKEAINLGIRKINIATDTFNSVKSEVELITQNNKCSDYFKLHQAEIDGAYKNVKKYIKIFGSYNKVKGGIYNGIH